MAVAGNLFWPESRHPVANWSSWKSDICHLTQSDPEIILETPSLRTRKLAVQGRCRGGDCWSNQLISRGLTDWQSSPPCRPAQPGLFSKSLPPGKTNATLGCILVFHVLITQQGFTKSRTTRAHKMHHSLRLHCEDLDTTPKWFTQMIKRWAADSCIL